MGRNETPLFFDAMAKMWMSEVPDKSLWLRVADDEYELLVPGYKLVTAYNLCKIYKHSADWTEFEAWAKRGLQLAEESKSEPGVLLYRSLLLQLHAEVEVEHKNFRKAEEYLVDSLTGEAGRDSHVYQFLVAAAFLGDDIAKAIDYERALLNLANFEEWDAERFLDNSDVFELFFLAVQDGNIRKEGVKDSISRLWDLFEDEWLLRYPGEERLRVLQKKAKVSVSRRSCFIATACCNQRNSDWIDCLIRYRDSRLSPTRTGRAFVGLYECISPPIAKLLDNSSLLRYLVKWLVIAPAVYYARKRDAR